MVTERRRPTARWPAVAAVARAVGLGAWALTQGCGVCVLPEDQSLVALGARWVVAGAETSFDARLSRGPWDYPALGPACRVAWSMAASEHAELDATTGVLRTKPSAPDLHRVVVHAQVNDREATHAVVLYRRELHPLVGTWRESSLPDCVPPQASPPAAGGRPAPAPRSAVGELEFEPEGEFSVTWIPFESYRDYWGTYTFDPATRALRFTVTGGNHVPPVTDLDGTATVAPGGKKLVLDDLWLGHGDLPVPAGPCPHRWEQR
jgi:hypothetical protein